MSGVGYDSDEMPVYSLGQVIPKEKCGDPITGDENHDELLYCSKFRAFGAVKENGDVGVGITGEFFMQKEEVVEKVLMIFGPNAQDMEIIPIENIFKLECKLKFPEGYWWRDDARRNRVRFSVSAACQRFWDAQPFAE